MQSQTTTLKGLNMNNESLIEHIKETAALMHQVSMQAHGIEHTQAQGDKVDSNETKPDDSTS